MQNWLKAEAYDGSHEHEHHHHHHEVNRHDAHIKALCLTIDAPLPADKFEAWLDLLLAFQGPNLLRIKGIINVAELDGPVVIHGVQHIFHPPVTLERWPSSDRRHHPRPGGVGAPRHTEGSHRVRRARGGFHRHTCRHGRVH